MARFRRKRGGSRKAKSIPVAVAAPMVYIGYREFKNASSGHMDNVVENLTGYNPERGSFNLMTPIKATYGPMVAGVIGHKIANKVGLNNYIRRATMGYLSL